MPSPQHPFRIILFNKPFRVLCQFSEHEGKDTLAKHLNVPDVYPAGRLDYDSEGLLILTNNGQLQSLITHPTYKLPKTYWVQVEGDIDSQAISMLCKGVTLKDGITQPATAKTIPQPPIWPRNPPIRQRANITTSWVELTIREGKNRQVRRMTAAVGYPTLRLIRKSIGPWSITGLEPGNWMEATLPSDLLQKLNQLTLASKQPASAKKFSKRPPHKSRKPRDKRKRT